MRQYWWQLEQAAWEWYGVSNVIGVIDIKPLRLATSNLDFVGSEGYSCLKVLVVYAITGEILFTDLKPGDWTDDLVLERSYFGRMLTHASNPLQLPKQMRIRNSNSYAVPVFLTDRKFNSSLSPYVYVSDGVQRINNLRLVVERFLGRFSASYRFFLSRTWVEHNHYPLLMVIAAINLHNWRTKMPADPTCEHLDDRCGHDHDHVCYRWCYHHCNHVENPRGRGSTMPPGTAEANRTTLTNEWLLQQDRMTPPPEEENPEGDLIDRLDREFGRPGFVVPPGGVDIGADV